MFELSKWAKEILRFSSIKSQFILEGNIYDIYPIEVNYKSFLNNTSNITNNNDLSSNHLSNQINNENETLQDKEVLTVKLIDFIGILFTQYERYDMIVSFEPIFGFRLIRGSMDNFKKFVKDNLNKDGFVPAILSRAYEAIENMVNTNELHVSVIINFASRLREIAERDIDEFLYKMFRLSQNALPKIAPSNDMKQPKFNVVFILVDKEADLPAWYSLDNHKVKVINIPRPDNVIRRNIIETLLPRINGYEKIKDDPSKKEEIIDLFIDNTHKMFGSEIVGIVSLAKRENISILDINEAIRRYKVGVKDNPWSSLNWNEIANAEEILKRKVKGQDKAIRRACEIIRRSFFDISGSQFGISSSKPKGIMFFAGPTGVGKTELAKAITELVFGNQSSYIRFDMSEYSKEHTDQRLIGAPPGYVGYDAGGQLTNAIKQNPFSIVLFDEIEKAHPRIMDIFLQILDEGRLTSGRGETVYFNECIIIFTSNLGVYDIDAHGNKIIRVSPDMPYDKVEVEIKNFIHDYFKFRINRPEILNRIGENIIVFDFIRPESAKLIFEKMINNVKMRIYDSKKVKIDISETVYKFLLDYCTKDLSMGGRGIGNKIEEVFVNPLSTLLFKLNPKENETVEIENILQDDLGWELRGKILIFEKN
ncbi:MAG: AAA family ATPase [bacterium]|nr:AAA family ATPase [bacterium]